MKNSILLVDDEDGIRKVLGITLADIGYEVLTASSGEEALGLFDAARPPIVMTDIKMPGMDGIELLKRVKHLDPDTEVIMITGHGDLELAIRSLQFEAADFITKPINDNALEIALKRARERICMKAKLREYTEGLEQLVQEKTRKLLEAERLAAIGQTVATLAHAIKNIIGGLKGGIYVCEKGMELTNEEYMSQGWDMVRGNVEKIKNLALDLLNYAKEREPVLRPVNPNGIAKELHALMLQRSRECNLELRLDLDDTLSEVPLDSDAIHCCLLNLVSNAFDACNDVEHHGERKEVVIRTRRLDRGGVEYQIADSGCGLDEETKNKIFRSFFSTKGTRGTGLGLMITQKTVHEHGGRITVESEKGKGATFTVTLPGRNASALLPEGSEDTCHAGESIFTGQKKGEVYA